MSQILKRLENLEPFKKAEGDSADELALKSVGKRKAILMGLTGVAFALAASAGYLFKDKLFVKPEPIKQEISPEEALVTKNRQALLAFKENRIDEAEKTFKELIAQNPKRTELYINLASVYRAKGQSDEAQKALSEALAISPSHARALNNLALVELELGRKDEAEKNFKASLTTDPDLIEGILNLGIFYEKKGQYQDAIDWYKKYVTHPRSERATASLVKARIPRLNSLLQYLNRKQGS